MDTFLTFLDQYRNGIFMLLAILAFAVLMIQWLAWIFRLGRFKATEQNTASPSREGAAQFAFGEFLARIITDFRNLLAVLIVLVFTFILAYTILKSQTQGEMTSSLQAVMSTLGGLVGSIVGYYFGETAAKSAAQSATETTGTPPQQSMEGNAAQDKSEKAQEQVVAPSVPEKLVSERAKKGK